MVGKVTQKVFLFILVVSTGFLELKVSVEEIEGIIELRDSKQQQGGRLFEGNVFVDGEAVCDDQWGDEEAAVVCR